MAGRARAPLWFWGVAGLILAWGAIGVFMFYTDRTMDAAAVARLSAYDRALRASQPFWQVLAYGVAVWTGLLGGVALVGRSRHAHPIFVVSLVAVVVVFGWAFVATDLIAVKGAWTATAFPIFIAAVAVFQIWFADHAQKRGWLG